MDKLRQAEAGAHRRIHAALSEAEGIGDALCFLELALVREDGGEDLFLPAYARRGLAGLLGDCSRRVDRLCRALDRILGPDEPPVRPS